MCNACVICANRKTFFGSQSFSICPTFCLFRSFRLTCDMLIIKFSEIILSVRRPKRRTTSQHLRIRIGTYCIYTSSANNFIEYICLIGWYGVLEQNAQPSSCTSRIHTHQPENENWKHSLYVYVDRNDIFFVGFYFHLYFQFCAE